MSDQAIIADTITKFITIECMAECGETAIERIRTLCEQIDKLKPAKSVGDTTGFIAFNANTTYVVRVKLRVSRFLTRKLNLLGLLSDKQINRLASLLSNQLWTVDNLYNFEILHGAAITSAFRDSIGGGSCMTGGCADYTRLYEINPTRFGLLTVRHNNDSGRAILYYLDNGKTLQSRIYCTDLPLREHMLNYATERSWFLNRNICGIEKIELVMSNLLYNSDEIPYLDSLSLGFIDYKTRTLTIFARSTSGLISEFSLCTTDGQLEPGNVCYHCEDAVNDDDYIVINGDCYCADCASRNFSFCESCNEYGDINECIPIYSGGNSRLINSYVCSSDCAENKYYKCSICDRWFVEGATYSLKDSDLLCAPCFEDNTTCCDSCEEDFLVDDVSVFIPDNDDNDDKESIEINGQFHYCQDCMTEKNTESHSRGEKVRQSENDKNNPQFIFMLELKDN